MAENQGGDKAGGRPCLNAVQLSPNSRGVTIPPSVSQRPATKRRH
jgi:hypothetical protein